jgi:transposase
MALTREVAGALTHAELVDLVVRQSVLIDQLQAVIAQQRALIATLEARIRDLEQQLAQRDKDDPTNRMPGLKPGGTPRHRKGGPRKRRPRGFSRPLSPTPTEVVRHAADHCPHCQTPLDGGRERWRKEVLDLPPVQPARVIHHVFIERVCPGCGRRVAPPRATAAELGVLQPRERLGIELLARIAVWRTELRLPLPVIAWGLHGLHGLELSEGAIVAALRRVAQAGQAAVRQTLAAIRASPVVRADETGLRQDGTNGYLWSFGTPTARYYVRGGRNKEMVDQVLGPAFVGVLCTDFYAAYDHYAGPHQRCWGHLLRDIHDLVRRHPHDAALQEWAVQVHGTYESAMRGVARREPDAAVRERAQRACEAELLGRCAPYLPPRPEPGAPRPRRRAATAPVQQTLCGRMQKYLPELFTFVADPAVESTNNAAERDIRPVVVQRKISGGTRSPAGTSTFCTLATLFGTWRAENRDPLIACRQLLQAAAAASA